MSPSKKNEDEKSKKEDGLTEAKPLNLLNLKLGGMVKEVGSKPAKPPKTLKPGNRMTSEAAAGGITASSVASPGPPDYQGIRTAVNIGHLPNAVGRDPLNESPAQRQYGSRYLFYASKGECFSCTAFPSFFPSCG